MNTKPLLNGAFGRRDLLRAGGAGGLGLAAAALTGCGEDDDEPLTPTATAASATATAIPGSVIGKYSVLVPESSKTPKRGGVMKVAASWDVATFDPTKSAAGGTITVPNTVYNRLLGFARGPSGTSTTTTSSSPNWPSPGNGARTGSFTPSS